MGVGKYPKVSVCALQSQEHPQQVPPGPKKESQVHDVNGIIMVSRAHNMCKPGLDPIDCKSSFYYFYQIKWFFEEFTLLTQNLYKITNVKLFMSFCESLKMLFIPYAFLQVFNHVDFLGQQH